MLGPIPTGTGYLRTAGGPSKCYGTPASVPTIANPNNLGRYGASLSSFNFIGRNLKYTPLPFPTSYVAKLTFRGPMLATPVAIASIGTADNLFSTLAATANMSGAHNAADISGVASSLFDSVVSQAILTANTLLGDSSGIFSSVVAQAYASNGTIISGLSNSFDYSASATLGLVVPMQGLSNELDYVGDALIRQVVNMSGASACPMGTTSSAYLYTPTVIVAPLTFAPCLAW